MPKISVQHPGYQHEVQVDILPNECPYCHFTIAPAIRSAHFIGEILSQILDLVCKCTNTNCERTFVVEYSSYHAGQYEYFYLGILRHKPSTPAIFTDLVEKLSPGFVEIFNQAKNAEESKLDKIAGMGYRKALEFLIKDYLIMKDSGKADSVKKSMLGTCIQGIDNTRIKDLAERATWLGNDETHYTRHWVDKDLNDLKALIRLVVHHIDGDLLYQNMLETMPKPTKTVTAKLLNSHSRDSLSS